MLHGLIETDAPIQRGDSGGPLVDPNGHVIGMDTAAADGGGVTAGASAAYSIPLSAALPIVQAIRSGSSSATIEIGAHRALLGVDVEDAGSGSSGGSIFGGGSGFSGPVAPVNSGALVEQVENPSPASTAGLSAGDVIVGVDNTAVASAAGLESALLVHHPGGSVTIKWVDVAGGNRSATVQLTSGPPA
jgi:S1-C subfamily serine protease